MNWMRVKKRVAPNFGMIVPKIVVEILTPPKEVKKFVKKLIRPKKKDELAQPN